MTSMDLSDNELSGEIPVGITDLLGLRSLNLSINRLSGRIPQSIGNMGTLESLDFSFNQLSGAIPASISNLTFLSYLNVAYNNLMGKIPTSTQLQSFDASNFAGNNLCGPPLSDNCSINAVNPDDAGNREGSEGGLEVDWFWFYVSATLGLVVAFWSIAGPLLFKKSWRYAYFKMLDNTGTKARHCFHR
ncbi:receptor like protein 15 [Hibiscus trionum]|uniref:Receptor like protein 15 n=1 Tax=Hibiscus trionum TaxID=183268 RepID=A0A9W7HKD3_HIBTR|nr:receptor like protein 15 [Hibiscus trionum]